MTEISNHKHQINECGLKFLVDECHISEEWLRDTFEVLGVTKPEPGVYKDPSNGDLWECSLDGKWRWMNGRGFSFIPKNLIRVGDSYDQKIMKSVRFGEE